MGRLRGDETFETYLANCEQAASGRRLATPLSVGFYWEYVSCWLKEFGDEITIVFAEHLFEHPSAVVVELCRWLGIDPAAAEGLDYHPRNPTRGREAGCWAGPPTRSSTSATASCCNARRPGRCCEGRTAERTPARWMSACLHTFGRSSPAVTGAQTRCWPDGSPSWATTNSPHGCGRLETTTGCHRRMEAEGVTFRERDILSVCIPTPATLKGLITIALKRREALLSVIASVRICDGVLGEYV